MSFGPGIPVATTRAGVWCTVADISGMSGNSTEDVGGGREAPKKGLMGHQRYIFPVAKCLFWLTP